MFDSAVIWNKRQKTLINLTNRSYFNLSGYDTGDILDTIIEIKADSYTPVEKGAIPTGKIVPLEGAPMKYREPKPFISSIVEMKNE